MVFRVFLLAHPLAKARNSQHTPERDECLVFTFSILQRCFSTENSHSVIVRLGLVRTGCLGADIQADRHVLYGNTFGTKAHHRVSKGMRSDRLIIFQRLRNSGVVRTSMGGAEDIGAVGV